MGAWIEILPVVRYWLIKKSHPTMGAWIEIGLMNTTRPYLIESHPTMGAWIEMFFSHKNYLRLIENKSHPTMGAWIEILFW